MKPFDAQARALLDEVHQHVGLSESLRLANAYAHEVDALDDDRRTVVITVVAALLYAAGVALTVWHPEKDVVVTGWRVAGVLAAALGATILIRKQAAREHFNRRWTAEFEERLRLPVRFGRMAMLDSFPMLTIKRAKRLQRSSFGGVLQDAVSAGVPPSPGFQSLIDEASHVLRATGTPGIAPFSIFCAGTFGGATTPVSVLVVSGLAVAAHVAFLARAAAVKNAFVQDLRDRTQRHRAARWRTA